MQFIILTFRRPIKEFFNKTFRHEAGPVRRNRRDNSDRDTKMTGPKKEEA
jgi:hypothetical protein